MKAETEQQPFLEYSDDPVVREQPVHDQNHGQDRRSQRISQLLVAVVVSVFWILVIFTAKIVAGPSSSNMAASYYDPSNRHNITSGARLVKCGDSPQEAREGGCKYDALLNSWIPSQCWDQSFLDEYKDDLSWDAFADIKMTQPLKSEEMGDVRQYYTSRRDHLNHCAMLWKKQYWMLFTESRAFDTIIASDHHTDHCASFLMDEPSLNLTDAENPTLVVVNFGGCWIRE